MKRIALIALFIFSVPCLAESGAYQVEVIIFRNLDVMAEPLKSSSLRAFSHLPGLAAAGTTTVLDADTGALAESENTAGEPVQSDLPDQFEFIGERSDYMNDVWRRLRASKAYRPLLWSSWRQNRVDYYPPIRVHNEQMIDRQLRPPSRQWVADLTMDDPLHLYRSDFFQLDGSVQLRRTRFLHIDLDLEYREGFPVYPEDGQMNEQPAAALTATEPAGTTAPDTGHFLHSLKQNRQIQTGKLHFFDTPALGALVFVTALID